MQDYTDVVLGGVSVLGATVGIVEAMRRVGLVDSRWAPVAAWLVAIAVTVVLTVLAGNPVGPETVVLGFGLGVTASGAYSQGKAISGR